METVFSIDLLSDLNVSKSQPFDWTGKPTSLFCVIAGNISDDVDTVRYVLEHLGNMYRGVFYIDGPLEHYCLENFSETVRQIGEICQKIPNVIYMHNHVVVLNGVAFVAVNGWYKNQANIQDFSDRERVADFQKDDLGYLSQTLRNLQRHKDVSKIIVVSSSIPSDHFMYRNSETSFKTLYEPALSLVMDQTYKVTHWLYSGTDIINDCVYNNRRFVNNPPSGSTTYWPKRILV